MHMRTTAFLTLTGTGTVIREWLNQLAAGSVATPELLLLGVAIVGLGLQTLHSHRTHTGETRVTSSDEAPPRALPAISPASSGA
jgi:hypothetical protein